MTDGEFLRHLEKTGAIEWYLFGSTGLWKINGTNLTLSEKQHFKSDAHCMWSESEWYIETTRYFIVLKTHYGSLEEFWKTLDFPTLIAEGEQQNEWFSQTPDC